MSKKRHKVLLAGVNKGCRFNNILLTRIQRFLQGNGHRLVLSPEEADTVIFNSCGVFDSYEDETLVRAREYARNGKTQILIVGCLNQANPDLGRKNSDLVFLADPNQLNEFFRADRKLSEFSTHTCQSLINDSFAYTEPGLGPLRQTLGRVKNTLLYALLPKRSHLLAVLRDIDRSGKHFVEISRGCVGNCTYCMEKRVNPVVTSRPIADILKDIGEFYRPGLKLCLTADDCGAYGVDIGQSLFSLLDAIQEGYPDMDIEICNMFPAWLEKHEPEYLRRISTSRIISINIPLQSGSPAVLQRMNRPYDIARVLRFIRELKRVSPRTLVWTHIITGFPGETVEDFEQSLSAIEAFDYLYWFPYAATRGTPSAQFDGQLPETEKVRRGRRLQRKLYSMLARRFLRDPLGRREPCRLPT